MCGVCVGTQQEGGGTPQTVLPGRTSWEILHTHTHTPCSQPLAGAATQGVLEKTKERSTSNKVLIDSHTNPCLSFSPSPLPPHTVPPASCSGAIGLLLLKEGHGQMGARGQALQVAVDAMVVELLAQAGVAAAQHILLHQPGLHRPEEV